VKRRKADDEYLIRKGLLDARLIDAVVALPPGQQGDDHLTHRHSPTRRLRCPPLRFTILTQSQKQLHATADNPGLRRSRKRAADPILNKAEKL
jgi:hypothetical protein